ncbi:MAG: glycosyltransferase family 2 protein [Planctomycetota bacterium]|jgi:glycosyltransferase involved in cell wall biosynthesis
MKLIIQIPCFNESKTLSTALSQLPRNIDGIDIVKWLVIDDGSTDATSRVAHECGVDYIVSHPYNMGLAKAFMTGLEACISHNADIIVNTDADNQYSAMDIPKLIKPILNGEADYVIGERPISQIGHFSGAKKILEKVGSFTVRKFSKTDVVDAPSGFRAITKDAAMHLNVFNEYTYTLETIIQAGHKGLRVVNVPISVNEDLRPSRLVKSIFSYIRQSVLIIIRAFVIYKPFRFFATIGLVLLGLSLLIGIRFLYYYFTGQGGGKIQSLILAAILSFSGMQAFALALLGDLHATNRKLIEKILYEFKKIKNSSRSTKLTNPNDTKDEDFE